LGRSVDPRHWPALRRRGVRLASELDNYGADAAALLKPQQDPMRPRNVSISAALADVVMAVLLALPRPEWLPISLSARTSQPLGSAWREDRRGACGLDGQGGHRGVDRLSAELPAA
jgi:hypothetical protein